MAACSSSGAESPGPPPARMPDPDTTAARVVPVAPAAPAELVLTGEIATDANHLARLFPLVGGEVVRVNVELGDEVRQGQVLAVLKSGEIAGLQNESTAGTANLAVARKNLAVAQELYQAGLSAAQDVYKARKEVERATGTATRNRKQLGVYGVTLGGTYALRAPISGFITEKNLSVGLRFTPANLATAFTVANLDRVWVLANVFETDLGRVHPGQAVEVTTLSYPDQPVRGRIDKVFNVLDAASKVMKVRCTLPNPGHRLKPGMHTQVRVLPATPVARP